MGNRTRAQVEQKRSGTCRILLAVPVATEISIVRRMQRWPSIALYVLTTIKSQKASVHPLLSAENGNDKVDQSYRFSANQVHFCQGRKCQSEQSSESACIHLHVRRRFRAARGAVFCLKTKGSSCFLLIGSVNLILAHLFLSLLLLVVLDPTMSHDCNTCGLMPVICHLTPATTAVHVACAGAPAFAQ